MNQAYNLIDEHEIAPLVGPEFVFGVHENKTAICRDFLSVHEETCRCLFHFVEQLLREKSLFIISSGVSVRRAFLLSSWDRKWVSAIVHFFSCHRAGLNRRTGGSLFDSGSKSKCR